MAAFITVLVFIPFSWSCLIHKYSTCFENQRCSEHWQCSCRNRLDGNFFSGCQAAAWRLLVYLQLGPWCFLPESHFILLEWPSSGGRVLARLHISVLFFLTLKWWLSICSPSYQCFFYPQVVAKYLLVFISVASRKSWVLRLQKKTWIFQYCTRRRGHLIKFLQKFVNRWMKSRV